MVDPIVQAQLALARRAPLVARDYYWDPVGYIEDQLGITLAGRLREVVQDIAQSWLWLHQRRAIANGEPVPHVEGIPDWEEGTPIPNVFAVAGGHKQGKSFAMVAVLLWLYHVSPRIVGCVYAPKISQASQIVWRYVDKFLGGQAGGSRGYLARIRRARTGGRTSPQLSLSLDRMITTQATNSGVSVQGSHEAVGVHYCEEAEGIDQPDVFDAIRTLTSDGVSLWLLCANPASSSSPFARLSGPTVRRYELSCLEHPNVLEGRPVVPGAVTREWVESNLHGRSAWAVEVDEHDEERATFELPWRPGQIWRPHAPWWWRVWGTPPPTAAADAAVSAGVYRRAATRDARAIFAASSPTRATLGVDSARGGEDAGVIARCWRGVVEVRREIHSRAPATYVSAVVEELEELLRGGCREVEIRVDPGGAYGAWVEDLRALATVLDLFPDGGRAVECPFGGAPYDRALGGNWVSCAYLDVGEALKDLALVGADPHLEEDLCSRRLQWVVRSDGDVKRDVRILERKEEFRRRFHRSPDKGDAVALALARWPQDPDNRGAAQEDRSWVGSTGRWG